MYINVYYLISYMDSYSRGYFDPCTYKCFSDAELSCEYKISFIESENGNPVSHKWVKKSFDERSVEKSIDFSELIPLPHFDRCGAADSFIQSYHDKRIREKLMREYEKNKDSFFLIEKYGLNEEWEEYLEKNQIYFAVKWCEENNVKYSLKPYRR